jgi:hypothetical protein
VKGEYDDVLTEPGDEQMVDHAIADALDAGLSDEEVNEVLRSEPKDSLWTPIVSGRLAVLARKRRGET